MLGYMNGHSETMNDEHRKYIEKHHNTLLPKIQVLKYGEDT